MKDLLGHIGLRIWSTLVLPSLALLALLQERLAILALMILGMILAPFLALNAWRRNEADHR